MTARVLLLFSTLVLVACGSIKNHYVMTGTPRAPSAGNVRIELEGAAVPPGFVEVAIVQTVGTHGKANLESLIAGLKSQAQQLGCNAVVRVHVDQGSSRATAVGVAGVIAGE
jgi:hypothetical protein